jgi:hypothetical protein
MERNFYMPKQVWDAMRPWTKRNKVNYEASGCGDGVVISLFNETENGINRFSEKLNRTASEIGLQKEVYSFK